MKIDNRYQRYHDPVDFNTAVQEYGKMGFHVEHMQVGQGFIHAVFSNWRSVQHEQNIEQKNKDREQRRNERLFR